MNFANIDTAKEIINRLYPQAKKVDFIEHGYDNLVSLVDKQYALRFPRNENAYARSLYERHVLLDLALLKEVSIPKVLGEGEDPPYVITTFLHGKHLSTDEIRSLPIEQQKKLGEDIARFAYAMHSLLSIEKAKEYREKFGLDKLAEEPWDTYFEKLLSQKELSVVEQNAIAKKYFQMWSDLKFNTPAIVIHDDLHNENLLFENGELVGVLDFGDTYIGTPEQELRQLYRINETILEAAVKKYNELSGYNLDIEAIKIWAITQELAAYSEKWFDKDTNHPAFTRATRNLNRWFPEGKWGLEIKDDRILESKQ